MGNVYVDDTILYWLWLISTQSGFFMLSGETCVRTDGTKVMSFSSSERKPEIFSSS